MDTKNKKVVPVPQVEASYYLQPKYASVERFISYFFQIDSIRKTKSKKILLVGVGDNLVPEYLKKLSDINVTTIDIDPELKPDFVGDVRQLPFEDGSFDVVAVFEVLEHLPFEELESVLKEIKRVTRKKVIISLPYRHIGFDVVVKFPFVRSIMHKPFVRFLATIPLTFHGFESSGQHYWEIGRKPFTRKRIRRILRQHFGVRDEYSTLLTAYRRFFVLEKNDK